MNARAWWPSAVTDFRSVIYLHPPLTLARLVCPSMEMLDVEQELGARIMGAGRLLEARRAARGSRSALTPLAAPAQEPGAARSYRPIGESSPELREYRQMQPVMDEMAAQIARMRDQMSKGDVTVEREREMAAEMKVMSGVMRSMAGRMGHPAMRAPERVKELRRMRDTLDAMARAHQTRSDPAGGNAGRK